MSIQFLRFVAPCQDRCHVSDTVEAVEYPCKELIGTGWHGTGVSYSTNPPAISPRGLTNMNEITVQCRRSEKTPAVESDERRSRPEEDRRHMCYDRG